MLCTTAINTNFADIGYSRFNQMGRRIFVRASIGLDLSQTNNIPDNFEKIV